MNSKIQELRKLVEEFVNEEVFRESYISIIDNEYETVLHANKEGILILIKQMIELCHDNVINKHCHIDENSIADNCERPIVITTSMNPHHYNSSQA